jgi:hypothetical protein
MAGKKRAAAYRPFVPVHLCNVYEAGISNRDGDETGRAQKEEDRQEEMQSDTAFGDGCCLSERNA